MKTQEQEPYQIANGAMMTLSLDVLKLYYDIAQKRLSDYHLQARETTERAYKVIAIYVTVLTLLSAYLYTNWHLTWKSFAILSLLAGACLATIFMIKLIFPRDYMPLGRTVSDLKPNEYAASLKATPMKTCRCAAFCVMKSICLNMPYNGKASAIVVAPACSVTH